MDQKKKLEFQTSRGGEGGSAIGLENSRLFLKIFFDPFPYLMMSIFIWAWEPQPHQVRQSNMTISQITS